MTWTMGRAEGKRRQWKRSSRTKRKTKKRERVPFADSQLYHTTLELMGNGSLCFHLYTVLPYGEWRCPVNRGGFQRCGKVLFGIHEHNKRHLLLSLSSLFLLGNGFCPVDLNIQNRNSMKSYSSKYLGRTTARALPTSLLPGRSSPGSTILNFQALRENKKTSWNPPEETRCLRPDGFPHTSAVAVPQSWATNTAWMV